MEYIVSLYPLLSPWFTWFNHNHIYQLELVTVILSPTCALDSLIKNPSIKLSIAVLVVIPSVVIQVICETIQ